MRWKQVYNEETEKYDMVAIDPAARRRDGHFIHGDIESFKSPIDGTVITGRTHYDDHCKRHGVVNASEFSPAHYERAAKKRADHYNGVRTRAETQAQRENIHEIMNHLEKG